MLLPILYNPDIVSQNYLYLVFGFYLVFIARVMLKDYRDIEGDKMHGKTTFLIQDGHKITTISSAVVGVIGSPVTSLALFSPTSDFMASILVISLGLTTLIFYRQILNNKTWPKIKPILPRLGWLYSLQSVVTLFSLIHYSGATSQPAYYAILLFFMCMAVIPVFSNDKPKHK